MRGLLDWIFRVRVLRLHPDDRLAVLIPPDMKRDEVDHAQRVLRDTWPDIKPIIFQGDIELVAIRPDESWPPLDPASLFNDGEAPEGPANP